MPKRTMAEYHAMHLAKLAYAYAIADEADRRFQERYDEACDTLAGIPKRRDPYFKGLVARVNAHPLVNLKAFIEDVNGGVPFSNAQFAVALGYACQDSYMNGTWRELPCLADLEAILGASDQVVRDGLMLAVIDGEEDSAVNMFLYQVCIEAVSKVGDMWERL